MTLALVAVDLNLTTDIRIDFTTQITLDLVVTLKVITQRNQLLIRQILDANVRIDTGRPVSRPGPAYPGFIPLSRAVTQRLYCLCRWICSQP